jgi:micrococcal nuclease
VPVRVRHMRALGLRTPGSCSLGKARAAAKATVTAFLVLLILGSIACSDGAGGSPDTALPPTSSLSTIPTAASNTTAAPDASAAPSSSSPAASEPALSPTATSSPTSASTSSPSTPVPTPAPSLDTLTRARVVDVVDGDTMVAVLHVGEGQREEVRLIGLDAPESGEDFADDATRALEDLVGAGEVGLETDLERRDQYGRLLAYVFCGSGSDASRLDVFANAELLRLGVATIYTVPPNVEYVDELQQAEDEARAAGAGMWAAAAPSPLKIARVEYDPPGDDTLDLNREYVGFEVVKTGSLAGYAVEDESGHRFDFPAWDWQKGQTVTLHSGLGTNTRSDLHWGAGGSAIWNNDGDVVKVLDPQGRIVETYAY